MSENKRISVANGETLREEAQKNSKGFAAWIKVHKRQLILAGISIPTIIAVALGLKNKDAIKALRENLNEEMKMAKYKIIFDGEEEEKVFSTYDEAEDYAHDLVGAYHEGGETMELNNPGDYPYFPEVEPDYEIIEE